MDDMHAAHLSYDCDGSAWMDMGADKTGTWGGHVMAGVALLVWTMHWNFGAFRTWLLQGRLKPYHSSTTYPIPLLPESIPVEAVMKIVVPLCGIIGNLVGSDGWRSNMCPAGSARENHFNPVHIFRYADAWILFTFMASGVVDLLGWLVELPPGTQQFFLATAFMLKSFVLAEGQHPDMLEGMVYYMLFLVTAGTSIFLIGELIWPKSFLATCGRLYCTYLQAIWYFGAARLLYEGRPAWDTMQPVPDMSPAMFVPVPFVFWMNFTSVSMFIVYLSMRRAFKSHLGDGLQAACSISGDDNIEQTHQLLPQRDIDEPHHSGSRDNGSNGGSKAQAAQEKPVEGGSTKTVGKVARKAQEVDKDNNKVVTMPTKRDGDHANV